MREKRDEIIILRTTKAEKNRIYEKMLGSEILYKLQTQYGIVQAKDYHSENNYSGDVRFWIPRRSICCFDIEENRIR